jgi:hypothetical protein
MSGEKKKVAGDWLTPETAIGCRLPCGATVERAMAHDKHLGCVCVDFDRAPAGLPDNRRLARMFHADGSHFWGDLPDLIRPEAPAQPAGAWVTWEGFFAAMNANGYGGVGLANAAEALGIPRPVPKVAPWEEAYEAWAGLDALPIHSRKDAWQAAWKACERHHRIMGEGQ